MEIKTMDIVINDGKRVYSTCKTHGHSDPKNTGVCPVCGAKTTQYREEKEVISEPIAIFSADEVEKAIKEFELFSKRKGKTWEKAIDFSMTKIRDFITLYFGEYDDGVIYLPFEGFKGTNKNVTEKLKKLFSSIEYHDNYNQYAVELKMYDDIVMITGYDW